MKRELGGCAYYVHDGQEMAHREGAACSSKNVGDFAFSDTVD